jgi:hypothetical protein
VELELELDREAATELVRLTTPYSVIKFDLISRVE